MPHPTYTAHAAETVGVGQIVHHENNDWIVARSEQAPARILQIGRASCRERV